MSAQVADAVNCSVTGNPGTGTVTLGARVTSYFPATSLTDGVQYYYCLLDVDANGNPNGGREIGYGTYAASGTTFSRDSVETSCDGSGTVSTSKINFTSGTQRLFVTPTAAFLGTFLQSSGVGAPSDGDNISWAARFRANNLAGADGAAITTWTDASGNSNTATGTGTLKTGANGINSKNVVRFNGSTNKFNTTAGGAGLTGNFYFAAVVKMASVSAFQNILTFGDSGVSQKRRSLFCYNNNHFYFIGQSADVDSGQSLVVSTSYFLEITYDNTAHLVNTYINGVFYKQASITLLTPSSAVLRLGVNPDNASEFLNGDLAEAVFLGSVPSNSALAIYRGYISAYYGLTIVGCSGQPIPYLTNASTFAASLVSEVASVSAIVVGTGGNIPTGGGTNNIFNNISTLSVNGNFAADASVNNVGYEHMLRNSSADNTASIQNVGSGFSAVRYLRASGYEAAAAGLSQGGSGIFNGADQFGGFYIEASNFEDNTRSGAFLFVQTGAINGLSSSSYKRLEYLHNGDLVFYDLTAGSSPNAILTLRPTGELVDARKTRLAADVTNATATMSNLSSLSVTLTAGWKYTGKLVLFLKNGAAAEGVAIDFDGGAATMTSFEAGFVAAPPGVTLGVVISAAIATDLTATTATTTYAPYVIEFTCVVNAGGTFIPRFSEVSHTSGTATALLGSYLVVDSPNN